MRFNGAYGGGGHSSWYFHFDSWRTNVQPGLWLPSFIYSEEKDLHYAMSKKLDFKAQTRLWGYNLGHAAAGAGTQQDSGRDARAGRYEDVE